MIYTAPAYLAQLQALLPTGAAWPRDRDAALTRLLSAWAEEFARLDARAAELLEETDPRTTYELLEDWERVLGLPDACTAAATTLPVRRALCWRKLAFQAGQTPAFYVALAASIGFTIAIHEFDPQVDAYDSSLVGQIGGGRYRHVWRVEVIGVGDVSYFRAGDEAGGLLRDGDVAIDLECILTAARPAHTRIVFSYPGDSGQSSAPAAYNRNGVVVPYQTATDIDLGSSIGGSHAGVVASQGLHGLTSSAGDVVRYVPSSGYSGPDGFTYYAHGIGGNSNTATVSLTIGDAPAPPPPPPPSQPAAPTASNRSGYSVASGTPSTIDLSSAISGSYSSIAASAGEHGSTTVDGNTVTYTPAVGFTGADSFTYTATGPGGTSAPATISLTVVPAGSTTPGGTGGGRRPDGPVREN